MLVELKDKDIIIGNNLYVYKFPSKIIIRLIVRLLY